MQWLSVLLLAIAVSLDSFGVGFTYGLRKMKIPLRSILIIACCSAVTLLISMGIGTVIAYWVSPHLAERIGGFVLILIGVWVLYQVLRPKHEEKVKQGENLLLNFEIKSLGVVIQILEKPTTADMDDSGTITGIEAILLGAALSLDAFGAGIGAALVGFSALPTAFVVACMSSIFVLFGMKSGYLFSHIKWVEKMSFIPGFLLILLGIWKM
ncbi:sporulation membrane protein YtaF [Bacillus taeanensis]|uniref:Sporulation membrane protein YtaF n=1 Tax=Bacillus taeanensis TaxID=273032 RepID=A0A366Y0Y8_9BACI|nr:sporulation membrane protein YtaF [Bacillus taeanensis]RBW71498.1 sporulation membrane protein YtaF [Bacillus taeanensis]